VRPAFAVVRDHPRAGGEARLHPGAGDRARRSATPRRSSPAGWSVRKAVIAAMTTQPWSSANSTSPSATAAVASRERPAIAGAGLAAISCPGSMPPGRTLLGDRLVLPAPVVDAEGWQASRNARRRCSGTRSAGVAARPGSAPGTEIELDHLRVGRRSRAKHVLLAVGLDQRDALVRAAGQAGTAASPRQREEAARRAVLGRHVPIVARSASDSEAAQLKYLTVATPVFQHLGHRQTRSVAVAPSGSSPVSRKPTTCGTSIESASRASPPASMPPTPSLCRGR
jgi:hypothetical protein